jgi:hypothetical protein
VNVASNMPAVDVTMLNANSAFVPAATCSVPGSVMLKTSVSPLPMMLSRSRPAVRTPGSPGAPRFQRSTVSSGASCPGVSSPKSTTNASTSPPEANDALLDASTAMLAVTWSSASCPPRPSPAPVVTSRLSMAGEEVTDLRVKAFGMHVNRSAGIPH